jgi:uncharacterized membrane protein YeaQ/YmgE (transglycosylase-associated protein family)
MCLQCYLVTAVIGAVIGLLAALLTKTKRLRVLLIDIASGTAGAVLVAWFLAPLAANSSSRSITTPEVVGAIFGAFVLLAISKAVRPGGW